MAATINKWVAEDYNIYGIYGSAHKFLLLKLKMNNLLQSLQICSEKIDKNILEILRGNEKILQAMKYSALAKGKKIRPFLFLEILNLLQHPSDSFLDIASAIELLHTYSLIHDDLPSMDNAELRRNQPTLHLAFDEATAILAGDALLTLAFGVISENKLLDGDVKSSLICELALASGYKGMIEGQLLDILYQRKEIDLENLNKIHQLKTGKLFRFCAIAPCIISGNNGAIISLEKFAYHFGMLFQITDDILDFTGHSEETGKDNQKDNILDKMNYVSLCGLSKTQEYAKIHSEKAISALNEISSINSSIHQLVQMVTNRKS
jgi:geranylgeranyl diphosphate synthase type II